MKHYFCDIHNKMISSMDAHVMCPVCITHPSIEIDELMLPLVNQLRRQGYNTMFSCSSHLFLENSGMVRVLNSHPYISFTPINITDRIDYSNDIGPFQVIKKNCGKNIPEYFSVGLVRADLIKGSEDKHTLTFKHAEALFAMINNGLNTTKFIRFNKIEFDSSDIVSLYHMWYFEAQYDFYWDKENNIVGYRPTLYIKCEEIEKDRDRFNITRPHYRYMSDLCIIFDMLEKTVYNYLGDCPISEFRYVPEVLSITDEEYMRFGFSFTKLQKYKIIEDEEGDS